MFQESFYFVDDDRTSTIGDLLLTLVIISSDFEDSKSPRFITNMLCFDLLFLTLPYLDTNDCAQLACVSKYLFHAMNTELYLRIIFRYHRIASLTVKELQRGLRYVITHPSVTYFNRNGQCVLNKFQIVRGWYSVDIFGRLYRKRRYLDCNIVQLEELTVPEGSCVTLDSLNTLKVRIRGNPQSHIIEGVTWFTISNKYYILYRDTSGNLRVSGRSGRMGELVNPFPVTMDQVKFHLLPKVQTFCEILKTHPLCDTK